MHRDLKPSNILVTMYDGRPVPKVIDFGVAKAIGGRLTDESMSTQVGAVVGTLEYMSPEQAGFSGQDIDTRADIYSLGVILYELLTGLRPIDGQRLRKAALAEMIRIIQQEEPSKPSTRLSSDAGLPSLAALRQTEPKRLTALLRGELDWVVMKCLEKSRDRRYETANGLARDIQHYLADEPVEARPASASYRVRKFLRRHKGPVLAASLVLLALIGGIIGTTGGLMLEARQRQIAEVNFKLARRHLYVARMHLAQVAWEDMRVSETIRLLDMYGTAVNNEGEPDDLKGFEWHYLNHLSHSYLVNLQGHSGDVFSVAFSPDGEKLASASRDQTVKVWDVASGRELTSKVHSSSVNGVVFSADGKWLASASGNFGQPGEVTVWDTAIGQETLTLKGHTDEVTCVAFSPDGKCLASASLDQTVKVWDPISGQESHRLMGHNGIISSVAFSPDGKRLASASGVYGKPGEAKVWDAANGRETLTLKGHASGVWSVAFSPDGKRLVTASDDQTVKLWDATSGEETLTLKRRNGGVTSVAFSPDGKRLASAGQGRIVDVWDARAWTPELKAEQQALCLIRFLRAKPLTKPALLDSIAADATISKPVRQRALELARDWPE